MGILKCMTGSESFRQSNAKVHVFWSPRTDKAGREVHIGVAARDHSLGITNIRSVDFPIAPGFRPELGRWTQAHYECADNTLLKVFAHRSTVGSLELHANLFIQMRERAAFRKLTIPLTAVPNATFSVALIEGRFDVLTVEQAVAEGAVVFPQFKQYFSPTYVNRTIQQAIIEPELSPRPAVVSRTVQTLAGEVRLAIPARRRALDI